MDIARGIIYVATGERYFSEVRQSAESVRRHMPDIPILLYTDVPSAFGAPFTEIRKVDSARHFFADKVVPLADSPFEKTLFLDTDTYVCADLSDIFTLLDRFEVAAAHAPMRHDRPYPTPNCFAEMNSGVLAYRKNARVRDMFARWLAIYEEELRTATQPEIGDQVHLRRALYESEVSLYVLPPEYNFRSVVLGWISRQKVRIIHGRASDMAALSARINSSTSSRVIFPSLDQFLPGRIIFLDRFGSLFGRLMTGAISFAVRAKKVLTSR